MKYGKIKTRDFIVTEGMDSIYPCSNGFVYVSFTNEITKGFTEVSEELFLSTLQNFFFEPESFKTKVPIGLADSKNYGFVRLTNDISDGSKYKVPTAYLLNEVYKVVKEAYDLAINLGNNDEDKGDNPDNPNNPNNPDNPNNPNNPDNPDNSDTHKNLNKYPVFEILSQMIGNKTITDFKEDTITETIVDNEENNIAIKTTTFNDSQNEIIETIKITASNFYDSQEIKIETKKQSGNIVTTASNSLDLSSIFEKIDKSAFVYSKLKNSHGVKIIDKAIQNGREETVINIKTNKTVATKTTIYNGDNTTQNISILNEGTGEAIATFQILTSIKANNKITMAITGSTDNSLNTKNVSSAYFYKGFKYSDKVKSETKVVDAGVEEQIVDMETDKVFATKITSFDDNFKITEKITLVSDIKGTQDEVFTITTAKDKSDSIETVID